MKSILDRQLTIIILFAIIIPLNSVHGFTSPEDTINHLEARQSSNAGTLHGTAPIPFFSLPTILPRPIKPDPVQIEAIRNTLALYPFGIDGKNFDSLRNVFTTDAVFNFSAPLGIATGLAAIQSAIANALVKVTTQHRLTTQYIEVPVSTSQEGPHWDSGRGKGSNATMAFSTTYFIADHFGTGVYAGQIATAYGQYQDSWVKQADGGWKIVYRNLVYMAPLTGNLSIFGLS